MNVRTQAPSATKLGCVPQADSLGTVGQKSLAVIASGETVGFPSRGGRTSTVHTASSLIYPTGAEHVPFIIPVDFNSPNPIEQQTVTLTTPGLYVITCSIHPYMFAAVIVDDPETNTDPNKKSPLPLDLGASITLVNGIGPLPTSSDLATRLLRTFFIATNPTNWQNYAAGSWTPIYPNVPVYTDLKDNNGDLMPLNLAAVLRDRYQGGNATVPLNPLANPSHTWCGPSVGGYPVRESLR